MTLSSAGGKDAANAPLDVSERNLFVLQNMALAPAPQAPEPSSYSTPAYCDDPASASTPVPQVAKPLLHGFSARGLWQAAIQALVLEQERGACFLLVPVFLSIGVVAYFSLTFEPDWTPLLGMMAALGALAWAARRRYLLHLCLLALLLCLAGLAVSKLETWRMGTRMLGADITVRLTGRVMTVEDMASGRKRLTIDVLSTERPKLRYQPQRVRISARKLPADIGPGSEVTGLVRLLPPSGPIRPDSYDTSFASYFGGIGASGFFLSGPELSAAAGPASTGARIGAAIEQARQSIADRIRHSIGGPEGEIAAALIVGVRAGIPEEINEAMRKTGIYHIISISGLHMALVAGTVMGLMRGLFALFPDFASRHPVKKYAALAALFAIVAYLLISGMVVAAVRSFIMLAVMLVALLFDRSALTMRNLAISAIVVILVTPHEVVGPSFQMSFAATAALVGAYAAWSDYRASRLSSGMPPKRSLPGALAHRFAVMMVGLAATSVVAGAATTLYAAWHFQRVAPLSLVANLAVMPIVSIIVMPFAVFASLAMPFGLDGPLLQVMGKGLTVVIVLSERIADMSPIDAVGLISAGSVALATVALVIATMTTTWLRLAALPFAVASLAILGGARAPDVLISEDARLVAVAMGSDRIAANRPRPNVFTIDNWRRALDAETVLRPRQLKDKDIGALLGEITASTDRSGKEEGFACAEKLCLARHPSGALVVQAPDMDTARRACAHASLIVIEDATARNPCRDRRVAVVTRRQLAQKGGAEAFFVKGDPELGGQPAEVRFAIEGSYRPWHDQRRYSREARGLPPYERKASGSKMTAVTEEELGNVADKPAGMAEDIGGEAFSEEPAE